jgi:hypothetical protein
MAACAAGRSGRIAAIIAHSPVSGSPDTPAGACFRSVPPIVLSCPFYGGAPARDRRLLPEPCAQGSALGVTSTWAPVGKQKKPCVLGALPVSVRARSGLPLQHRRSAGGHRRERRAPYR